ncbi:MAG: fibronectin type III domain-containing protein, partial [Gammaproteobacteria bacterium]|nr:fibronectin type III domain-containing protein [Gammaproteobacteria bacterium]
MTLTLSEPVWAEAAPAAEDFALTVSDGGSPVAVTVTAVTAAATQAEAAAEMMLTLSGALGGSASVSLTYTANLDPAKRPRDAAGNRMDTQTVTATARRTLVVDFGSLNPLELGEDAGRVRAKLTLGNPPDAGRYTGCGLRLAASSVADADDVVFLNTGRQLKPGNGWSTGNMRLLRIVDDNLAEGHETLVVEGHCSGGDADMVPTASGLKREPVRLMLLDDESRKVTLSVDPDAIAEMATATAVTVTATLDGEATEDLVLPLSLSGTATAADYSVSGTQSVTIDVGASSGTTVLTITPSADDDAADETIVLDAALSEYAVTGATVTIAEPVGVVASLVNRSSRTLLEDAGPVRVQLAIRPKPAKGAYTGCRLRLARGSVAQAPADVTFANKVKLDKANNWRARAVLLKLVDDALMEGDEALTVEGHCKSSNAGASPRHAELVSRPLKLTIRDDEAPAPVTLTVSPNRIGETLGAQAVTVTAALAGAAAEPVTVDLSLGAGSYSVTGTQRIEIAQGTQSGSTDLTIAPTDDGNASDDTVTVTGTAAGRTVTGTSLTIREPTIVGGVDLSGLGVDVSVSPAAIAEGSSGTHTVSATLTGVSVPKVDVALVLSVRGTATQGSAHDYTLTGPAGWQDLTVRADDPHLTARAAVTVAALADTVEDDGETVAFSVSRVTWGGTVVSLNAPASATLTITEPSDAPPAPTGLTVAPASGDERHGFDVSWQAVTATPPVTGYVVRHRKVAEPLPDWTDSALHTGPSATITGLNAGTRYEVRVRARSSAGDGAESGSVYAYAADGDCTVGAPRVEAPSGVRSSTELEATWEAAACAPATSIAHYRVRYREDPDLEGVTNAWLEEASSTLAATLAGLTADTAYVVEVRAVATGGDNGPWSPPGRGRTALDSRLPPRVGAPAVAAHATHGDERLDATWTRVAWVDGNDDVQPITRYQYRIRPDGGSWTEPTDATAGPSETAALTRTIAGLGAGTWHSVQVRAVNRMMGKDYPGKWSEPGRGRTWGVPDRVERPAAYQTGATVEAVWDAPDDGGSAITDYDVAYRTQGSDWTTHPYSGCGMGACATEASIAAAATQVRVRAENSVGMGRWSKPADVQAIKLLRVSFGQASAKVTEGASLQVTLSLDSAADREVTVPLTTNGGAGSFRLDGAANNRVTFALGESLQRFDLAALQDADNDDATVTLGLGQLPNGVLRVAPSSLAVAIEDDEAANGAPAFASATATRTVAEDAPAGGAVGLPVAAKDPEGDALTYSLTGSDAALFAIDSTGQISLASGAELNFEAASSHALTVQAADGKDGAGDPDPAVDATITVTVNVTDVAEPPSAPDAPTLTAEANSLAVSWAAPDNAGPAVTGYDVRYRSVGAAAVKWTDASFTGTATTATLPGLAAGTAYEVRVRAANDEGAGGWSEVSEANTLAQVTLTASDALPSIGTDNAAVAVRLTGKAQADGGGTLSGEWLERAKDGTVTVLVKGVALTSGTAVTRSVSSDAPVARTYGFRASHTLDGRTGTAVEWIDVEWRPSVALSASPATVREAKGAKAVTVTATLTGTSLTAAAKTVAVSVGSGTATAVDDFAAVAGFDISIPGGTRSAAGTFTLAPVKDSTAEGAETVAVTGTATDGAPLAVTGTVVTIDDGSPELTVTAPVNGYVTGTTGSGTSLATVIDCGSGGRTDCAEEIADGSAVTLTATADDGYGLSGWTGDCSGTGACTVTVDANRSVGAAFVALPGKPAAPTAAPADHESLTVSWSAPSAAGSGITGYALRHSLADADSWTEFDTGGTATSATVMGLTAGTEYDVQVRAIAAEGGGTWSDSGQAVTLPEVTVTVDDALPAIPDGNTAAAVTLTARATAAEGTLTGRWVQKDGEVLTTVTGSPFDDANGTMTSGTDYMAPFSFDSPGVRTYGLMVAHGPNADHGEVGGTLDAEWVPSVVLSVDKASVAEDGGAETLQVTATLTGTSVAAVAKTVTVKVAGGTATVTDDFAPVSDFPIAIPSGSRSATGTFVLTPVEDTVEESSETVAVGGTAAQGQTALPVVGTNVTIANVTRHRLMATKPSNGRIAGSGINCGGPHNDCAADFADDASVTLTATPDAGNALGAWTGDCSGRGRCDLTMDADKTVGAAFGTARTLTVAAPANGKVTGTVGTESVIDCGTDCAETVADGTAVALKAAPASDYELSAWGGDCATETSADCSVSMDADRAVSVTFAASAVDGRCDETVVDGCADGTTLNTTAHADSDNHHHWRCDGLNGGANSAKCSKAKADCTGGSQDWTVGANSCSASVGTVTSGQTATATDGSGTVTGTADYKCDDGAWVEQSGSTCVSCTPVHGGWSGFSYGTPGACSASACGQSGTYTQNWSRTCTNPPPSCGGASCVGAAIGTQTLSCTGSDPRDGGWSVDYGPCSATACGQAGTQSKTCTNPAPGCSGANCTGDAPTQSCIGSNPRDGGWSVDYGPCSATACGQAGTQSKTCTNPAPGCGGANCTGDAPTQSCTGSNPRDGGWSVGYGPCSATACGQAGTQSKTCTNPAPGCGGANCTG